MQTSIDDQDHDPTPQDEPEDTGARAPADIERVVAAVAAEARSALLRKPAAGLHLVATPIGNMSDITLRAVAMLARADRVYCEDTRQTLKLLNRFGLSRRLGTYHEHNAEQRRPEIVDAVARGETVALVSDAGTPLVSDPGYKLVRAVVDAGFLVTALPGPSAALTALTASGLPTDTFLFAGFLPPKSGARRTRIEALTDAPASIILFESANRVAETLADLAETLGTRPAVVARELTKLHEEHLRGTLDQLAILTASRNLKGECVIVVGPPLDEETTDDAITTALRRALETQSLRDAVRDVAEQLHAPKKRVYTLAVALRSGG